MVNSEVYKVQHWDDLREKQRVKSNHVDATFSRILNYAENPPLSVKDFDSGPLATVHWNTAASGIEMPEDAARELEKLWANYLEGIDGPAYLPADEADEEAFGPQAGDFRAIVFQHIKARRGRQNLRDSLRKRYGDRCMMSGCALMDVVEAAHIKPYRADGDNHPANGLLLRTDLHTLFDLDLIGIEPGTFIVRVHPQAKAEYGQFDGIKLKCSSLQPSDKSLAIKWESFCKKK